MFSLWPVRQLGCPEPYTQACSQARTNGAQRHVFGTLGKQKIVRASKIRATLTRRLGAQGPQGGPLVISDLGDQGPFVQNVRSPLAEVNEKNIPLVQCKIGLSVLSHTVRTHLADRLTGHLPALP